MNTLPHKVSAVTVTQPVDATRPRKTRSDKGQPRPSVELKHIRVDPEVWAVAKRIKREGERIVIVNESTVELKR